MTPLPEPGARRFLRRVAGALWLRAAVYEEVEADRGATWQAFAVVLLAALAAGIGALENHGVAGIAGSAVAALGGWVLWALLTWLVGTRVLPGPSTSSDPGELLRTIGFSCAPGMLCLLGLVPGLAGPVFVVAGVWMLVAMVVAVRQALDYESTWRAIAVCALGFPLYVVVVGASLLLLGPWPV